VVPLVAGLIAFGVSKWLPPVYEASVSLLVRPSQPLASLDPNVAALTSDQVSGTYARLMTERPLLKRVISDLHLNVSPEELQKQIKVTPQTNTAIIDVTADSTDRNAARDIADTLVRDFLANVKAIQQQEAGAPNSRSADNLMVVAPAVVPDKPVSPRIPLNVAIAAAIGLLAAVGVAVLRDSLDQSIKSDEELAERVGLVPIGHIGYASASKGKLGELVVLSKNAPTAEAYKTLRTNLLFSALGNDLKTIVVTSAAPDEGKSRIAANLAVVLAAAGKRTLILDADFRRPSQHRIFGKVRNVGLSNLVLEDRPQEELLTRIDGVPNLWFLASGPSPPNPSELLGSNRVKALIAGFRRDFEYIIVDSPPVNAVTDAPVLAAEADATVLIAEEGRTTYSELTQAKAALERVSARILGVVINKIRANAGRYHHYEYGYYMESNGHKAASVVEDGVPAGSGLGVAQTQPSSTQLGKQPPGPPLPRGFGSRLPSTTSTPTTAVPTARDRARPRRRDH
jgi:capsular exopolysaccharide synthesis family protein